MRQPHPDLLGCFIYQQQALAVGSGQDQRIGHRFEQLHVDWLGQGEDFQQLQHHGVQAAKASFDQLGEPRTGDDSPVPAPHTRQACQVAAVQPAQNQLPQVQRITLGKPPQGLRSASIDLPAKRGIN